MSNYVLGFLWLFVMIFFIYGLGAAITKEDTFMPDRLIVGYIGYSFIIALFGIPIQVFNAPWKIVLHLYDHSLDRKHLFYCI